MVRVGKIRGKSILCLLESTRKYTNLLEHTRNVHKYVIYSFRLCFLLIFAKVERVWSEMERIYVILIYSN